MISIHNRNYGCGYALTLKMPQDVIPTMFRVLETWNSVLVRTCQKLKVGLCLLENIKPSYRGEIDPMSLEL